MIRLLHIEWLKVKSNSGFWVILALYMVGVYMVCSLGTVLLNATVTYTSSDPAASQLPPELNMYNFPSIWHNLTYMGSWVKMLLGVVMIVLITNEYSFKTQRQNIIDGFTRVEIIGSKFLISFLLAVVATGLMYGLVMYFGLRYSDGPGDALFYKAEFLFGYFVQTLAFLSFAVLVAHGFKSAGLAIVFSFAYILFLEAIIRIFLDDDGLIIGLLPDKAMDNLIQSPVNLFDPESVQRFIDYGQLAIVAGWIVAFNVLTYFLLSRRDS